MKSVAHKINWSSTPFVRLVLVLILGILIHIQFNIKIPWATWLLGIGSLGYCCLVLFSSKRFKRVAKPLFGAWAMLIICLFGYCLTEIRTESKSSNHLIHQEETIYYQGEICAEVQQKAKSKKAILKVSRIFKDSAWHQCSGKVLLYFSNSDSNYIPQYGDELMINQKPNLVSPPSNPQAFDYRKYLSFQQIHHQQFLKTGDFILIKQNGYSGILGFSLRLRQAANQLFKKFIPNSQSYSIATALVLGVKEYLDDETKTAYSSAGAMHVLAVSGLHVGILVKLLSLLFGKWRKDKKGKIAFIIFIISILWVYAMITGFSASVLRAVTMFSLIIIAQGLNRQSNIYNTLALSAFILLCYNPYLIMGVGFQLSYSAVVGIVYLQPKLVELWKSDNRLLNGLWELTCVSVAAQVATFPIGLLYFHQFPTYFWISNFFVIPAATVILQLGIGLLLIGNISIWLAEVIGWLLSYLIEFLNVIVFYIQEIPLALINKIDISILETWLIYLIILSITFLFTWRKLFYLKLSLIAAITLTTSLLLESYKQQKQKTLTVYQINKQSNIGFINASSSTFLADSALLTNEKALLFHVKHHLWYNGIQNTEWVSLDKNHQSGLCIENILQNKLVVWEGKRILLYRQSVNNLSLTVDYLVLSNNAVTNWNQLNHLKASYIIIDSSNSWKTASQLIESKYKPKNLIIFNLRNQGAFSQSFH